MKLANKNIKEFHLFGHKIFEIKEYCTQHGITNDNVYDNVFYEKMEKFIESKN